MELPPPPPQVEIVEYNQEIPGLSDPVVVEAVGEQLAGAPPLDLDSSTGQANSELAELDSSTLELSKLQRIKQKLGQVVLGESLGTAFDVAAMAVGVPLPVSELTGSAIDTKIYGGALERDDDNQEQSRAEKLGRKVGSIAIFAVTGLLAQKFGGDVASAISDQLDQGTMGEYITPLTTKFGAMTGVSKVIKKLVVS